MVYPQEDRTYNVTESYSVDIPDGEYAFFDINLPVSYGYQSIDDMSVNGTDDYEIIDKNGYQILHGMLEGTGSVRTIELRYSITSLDGSIQWDGSTLPEDTSPEQFIDSDNDSIIAATKPLIADDAYKTAKNVFDYVSTTLQFRDQDFANQRMASGVLGDKTGVCEDFANLMVAMLRAADIPARSISGMTYRDLKKADEGWEHSAAEGSHAWVEFYTDDKWHFADPTWGVGFFDDCDGYHISYGAEPMIRNTAYIERIAELESENYKIPLSITAPFKVTFWSKSDEVIVTPTVSIVQQ
jgi:hypothetical protein